MTGRSKLPRAMTRLAALLPDQALRKTGNGSILSVCRRSDELATSSLAAPEGPAEARDVSRMLGSRLKAHVEGAGSTSTVPGSPILTRPLGLLRSPVTPTSNHLPRPTRPAAARPHMRNWRLR